MKQVNQEDIQNGKFYLIYKDRDFTYYRNMLILEAIDFKNEQFHRIIFFKNDEFDNFIVEVREMAESIDLIDEDCDIEIFELTSEEAYASIAESI